MGKFIAIFVTVALLQVASSKFPFYNTKPFTHTPLHDVGEPLILTPYIKSNLLEVAKAVSTVNSSVFLNVASYSGYFTVDDENDANIFFWFFPSAHNYAEDPVVLWLQGGPGVSSLYGLFDEHGPFTVEDGTLGLRQYSWHKNYSVLYIDQPVGTGFSFTSGSLVTNQTQVGEHLYSALTQFFTVFSEIQNNDFYVSGESYGGKYVPAISYTIHKNNPTATIKINLKGLIIGNGLSDPKNQFKYGDLLYQIGLIDLQVLAQFNEAETLITGLIDAGKYEQATFTWNEMLTVLFNENTGLDNIYDFTKDEDDSPTDWEIFIVQDKIREALHVGSQTYTFENDSVYESLYADITKSVANWVSELLSHYRVLIFNGQLDIIVGYVLTANYLQNLNFDASDEYLTASRDPWFVGQEVAGYVKTAGNLTEVLVRNAGHMVPADQPEFALDLISKFISNEPIAAN